MAVRAVAVIPSKAPDETMLSKDAIHEVQQQAGANLGAMVNGALRSLLRLVARRRTTRMFSGGAGRSRRVVDPGTSDGNADAAYGVRSHEGRWTPGGRGDFAAATRVAWRFA